MHPLSPLSKKAEAFERVTFGLRASVPRLLLLCTALLAFPTIVAAQCTSKLAVQRVWAEDTSGQSMTHFIPGQTVQFFAELNNSYGGYLLAANGAQVSITSTFYTNTKTVSIPPGTSQQSWSATAPAEGNYIVTVRAYDQSCGIWQQNGTPIIVSPPAPYGNYVAIAWSPSLTTATGISVVVSGQGSTAEDAQTFALNGCLKLAGSKLGAYYNDCQPYGWAQNGYLAFARSIRGGSELDWADGEGWGSTSDQADQAAIKTCQDHGGGQPGTAACGSVASFPSYPPPDPSKGPSTGGALPPSWKPDTWKTAPLPRTNLSVAWISTDPPIMRITWNNPTGTRQSHPDTIEINNGNETRTVDPTNAWSASFNWDNRQNVIQPALRGWECFRIRATNKQGSSWWEPNSPPWYRCAQ